MSFFDCKIFDNTFFDAVCPTTSSPVGTFGTAKITSKVNPEILKLICLFFQNKVNQDLLFGLYTDQELLKLWTLIKGDKTLPETNLEMIDLLGVASGDFINEPLEEEIL
jgi:hypothetical protein